MDERSFPRHTHYGTYQQNYGDWHDRGKPTVSVDIEKLQMNNGNNNEKEASNPTNSKNLPNGQPHKV